VRCFAQARHRAERRRAVCGGYIGEAPEPCQRLRCSFFTVENTAGTGANSGIFIRLAGPDEAFRRTEATIFTLL
jgi:hypothetical protein